MDADFWHARWDAGKIAFHEGQPNVLLRTQLAQLALSPGSHVFLPLCGKTRDIAWLVSEGFRVTGVELSTLAIEQLFLEMKLTPEIEDLGLIKRFSSPNIDILVGDFFEVTKDMFGPVDAVYDRAAMVAMPAAMRADYAEHLSVITEKAPQLLISFEYDQSQINGPPFSVSEAEIRGHYDAGFHLRCLKCVDVLGGLKGVVAAREAIWHLTPK